MLSPPLERLAQLTAAEREHLIRGLSSDDAEALLYDWRFWAREAQLPPEGDWAIWVLRGGRGSGKTRPGAEFVRAEVMAGRAHHVALVGRTPADVRDVMIDGESGIRAISPDNERPEYQSTRRRLVWPNGAIGTAYSSWEPDMIHGPQHDLAWGDEFARWKYLKDTFDGLMLGLRIGPHPRAVFTTTPRPLALLRAIEARATTVVTLMSTFENLPNLAPTFRDHILSTYRGTSLEREQIYGEILDEAPGALWQRSLFAECRQPDRLDQVVVGVDPAASSGEDSDETGIVVAGRENRVGYVLADRSGRYSPDGWGRRAVEAYHEFGAAFIVAESNQGGEMVEHVLRTVDPTVTVKLVHAKQGKQARAQPIAGLYEQGKVFHTRPFTELEDQLCTYQASPGEASPDRLDAAVYALTELLLRPYGIGVWLGNEQRIPLSTERKFSQQLVVTETAEAEPLTPAWQRIMARQRERE